MNYFVYVYNHPGTIIDKTDYEQKTQTITAEGNGYASSSVTLYQSPKTNPPVVFKNTQTYMVSLVANAYSPTNMIIFYQTGVQFTDGNAAVDYKKMIDLYKNGPVSNSVTFNSNGGSPVDSGQVVDGGKVTRPPDPAKDGYVFGGWYEDNETFADEWKFESDTVSAPVTLYAKWIPANDPKNLVISADMYTVTYNNQSEPEFERFPVNQSGTISMGMGTVSGLNDDLLHLGTQSFSGGRMNISVPTPVLGVTDTAADWWEMWMMEGQFGDIRSFLSSDGNVKMGELVLDVSLSSPLHGGGVINYVPNLGQAWCRYMYIYSEGDVVIKGETINQEYQSSYEVDISLTEGWNCLIMIETVSGENESGVSYTLKNETPKADSKWYLYSGSIVDQYTVTFMDGERLVQNVPVNPGETISVIPSLPARPGYTFDGWYRDNEIEWNFGSDTVTDHIILYAKWIPTGGGPEFDIQLTIKNLPAGTYMVGVYDYSGTISSQIELEEATSRIIMEEEKSISNLLTSYTIKITGLPGGLFDKTGMVMLTDISSPMNTVRFYKTGVNFTNGSAVVDFEQMDVLPPPADVYNVTFMDGENLVQNMPVNSGETISVIPSLPPRTGYTFDGWYRENGIKWSLGSDTVTAPVTLYAKWIPIASTTPGRLTIQNFPLALPNNNGYSVAVYDYSGPISDLTEFWNVIGENDYIAMGVEYTSSSVNLYKGGLSGIGFNDTGTYMVVIDDGEMIGHYKIGVKFTSGRATVDFKQMTQFFK